MYAIDIKRATLQGVQKVCIIIYYKNKLCIRFQKDKLVSIYRAIQVWKKDEEIWKMWIAIWNDFPKLDMK